MKNKICIAYKEHPAVTNSENFLPSVTAIPTRHYLAPTLSDQDKQNDSQAHFFKTGKIIYRVDLSSINYILAYGNYSKIVMCKKQLVISTPLKELEGLLNEKDFVRIHRSVIVSVKKIEMVKEYIVYIDDVHLPVGKSYIEYFYKVLFSA